MYQSTNASLQFLTTTDANRKKFLVELFGVEEYGKYYEVFREVSKGINTKLTALSAKSDTILKWLQDNKLETTNILPEINLPKISEEDETRLRSLQLYFENN